MNTKTISAALTCALLAGCSSSSSDAPIQKLESQDVSINFAAVDDSGNTIACDTVLSAGQPTTNYRLKDFRLFLHDIALFDEDGDRYPLTLDTNDWQQEGVALLNFTNKLSCDNSSHNLYTTITGKVSTPADITLMDVGFTIGVPAELNHQDPLTSNNLLKNTQGMHWSWQTGYKHARFDVVPDGGISRPAGLSAASSWNFHLGSGNCTGNPSLNEAVTCANPNRPTIRLSNFDAAINTVEINYGRLVSASNLSRDEAGAPGCMSGTTDPECTPIFRALGMNLATGEMDSSLTQTVFSVQ